MNTESTACRVCCLLQFLPFWLSYKRLPALLALLPFDLSFVLPVNWPLDNSMEDAATPQPAERSNSINCTRLTRLVLLEADKLTST